MDFGKGGEKMKKNSWIIDSKRKGDFTFDLINLIAMIILTALVFYPMYLVFISAFSSPDLVYNGKVTFLPAGNNLEGLKLVLETESLWSGYKNTIIYTLVGTAINLVMTITGAFVLSRKDFMLKKPILLMVVFTMFFGGGMIPSFLLVKDLKLLNTIWSLVLPGAVSTWNLMIAKTFMASSVPDELQDAALIDGCNNTRFFISIVIPISSTIIAVLGLFYGVGHWNSYWNAMLYIKDIDRYPLQLVLRNLLLQAQTAMQEAQDGNPNTMVSMAELYYRSESMKYIVVLAAVLPITIIFPFVEKYFVKGVMIGSIKG